MVCVLSIYSLSSGYVKTYIVLPSIIWGVASGPLVDQGIQNPFSNAVPRSIKYATKRGRAGVVGEGKNLWNNVHIDESMGYHDYSLPGIQTSTKRRCLIDPELRDIAYESRGSSPAISWQVSFSRKLTCFSA